MHVARGVAPGLWGSHASGGSEIESILQNRQSTVLPFVMPHANAKALYTKTLSRVPGMLWPAQQGSVE